MSKEEFIEKWITAANGFDSLDQVWCLDADPQEIAEELISCLPLEDEAEALDDLKSVLVKEKCNEKVGPDHVVYGPHLADRYTRR